jgi:RND superfamily putative drug exporter
MYDRLGKLVARHWPWVLVAWVLGVLAIKWAAPPWHTISQDDDIKAFPPHFNSVVAHELLERAFPKDKFNSQAVVVVERSDGPLSEADMQFIDVLAARLDRVEEGGKQVDENGRAVRDEYGLGPFVTPTRSAEGQLLKSKDQRAALLFAPAEATFMSQAVVSTVKALRGAVDEMRRNGEVPAGIRVALTGSAGVGADLQIASDESLDRSLRVTIVLVVLILLVVYRSPIVAFIPLVTITISVVTAMSFMALLTLVPWMHFQVMKITDIFVIVVLFGAGTDYCLFLVSRYREELEHGADRPTAVHHAIRDVGGALAASAATVVCGLGMMVFAEFGKFRYTGPAVAISLAVALVGALTLTPALLRMLGPIVFWPFKIRRIERPELKEDAGQRFWDRVSHGLVRRPGAIWGASVLVMIPFAIWGTQLIPTYNFLAELDENRDSKVGAAIMGTHFPPGQLGPVTVLVQDRDIDLRSPAAQKDIAELTRRMREVAPDRIALVLSATSPLGEPLEPETPAAAAAPPKGENAAPPAAAGSGNPLSGFLRGLGNAQRTATNTALEAARKKANEYYISSVADGHVMRMMAIFAVDPFSDEAMQLTDRLDDTLARFRGTTLSNTRHAFAGLTSSTYDLKKITQSDQKRINWMVLVAVYIILIVLLRRPLICLYLMFTVLLGYYATLGVTQGVFEMLHHWQHPGEVFLGLDWKVAFFLFIILVAVGQDYNIFLMARVVEEEEKRGPVEGVRMAVARTGGIITSCGVIMAGTFASMATGTLAAIIQLGFALAFGVLLDTFVVRPVLVPAFLLVVHRLRAGRRPPPAAAPPAGRHTPARHPEHIEPGRTMRLPGSRFAVVSHWLRRMLNA